MIDDIKKTFSNLTRKQKYGLIIVALFILIFFIWSIFASCSEAGNHSFTVQWEDENEFSMIQSWSFEYSIDDQTTWIALPAVAKPDAEAEIYSENFTAHTIEGYRYIYVRGRTLDVNNVYSDYSEAAKSAFRAGFPLPLKIKSIVKTEPTAVTR